MHSLSLALKALHQHPVAYYKCYAKIMGSVSGGVALSQLMFHYAVADGNAFTKTDDELRDETGLTIRELREAKSHLKTLPFITVSLKGIPATTVYEIDEERLWERLGNPTSLNDAVTTGLNDAVQTSSNDAVATIKRDIRREIRESKTRSPLISPQGELHENAIASKNEDAPLSDEAISQGEMSFLEPNVTRKIASPTPPPLTHATTSSNGATPPKPSRRTTRLSPELLADADEVLAHLCDVTSKKFRVHGEIPTILAKGYTKAQCLLVIDWLHIVRRNRSKMDKEWVEQRLGISTPFYEKNFAGYLADAELWHEKGGGTQTSSTAGTLAKMKALF